MLGVARRHSRADAHGGSRDQAVGLTQRDSPARVVSTPASRPLALCSTEGSNLKSAQEARNRRLLLAVSSTEHLLDVDRADPWHLRPISQTAEALGGGEPSQRVDQDRRVEQQRQRLANAGGVTAALRRNPAGGIAIPFVLTTRESAEPCFDVLPAALILERSADRLADEHAPTSSADPLVELPHELVIQAYVQSHGHTLAHTL